MTTGVLAISVPSVFSVSVGVGLAGLISVFVSGVITGLLSVSVGVGLAGLISVFVG